MTKEAEGNGKPRERLLSLKQAAARFQCHHSTVSYWICKGMIPCVRMPSGTPKIRESVVEQYLKDVKR